MTVYEEIRARLDDEALARIDAAALYSAARLRVGDGVAVELCPGDGTRYRVVMGRPALEVPAEDGRTRAEWSREAWVGIVELTDLYPWVIGDRLHPAYVAEKWCRGHAWTAVVLTELLNRTAAHWERRMDNAPRRK